MGSWGNPMSIDSIKCELIWNNNIFLLHKPVENDWTMYENNPSQKLEGTTKSEGDLFTEGYILSLRCA